MVNFTLATKLLYRQWRAGEVRLLFVALVLAITALTAINFYTNRVEQAISDQASELIAADRVLNSPYPIPKTWQNHAQILGLATASTLSFPSIITGKDKLQLSNIKAVSQTYPLKSELRISEIPFSPGQATTTIPQSGDIWVEQRLLELLGLELGDIVTLGNSQFTLRYFLTYEPDRSGIFFNAAPRVLINLADVEATGILQPGSRATYYFLIAGQPRQLDAFTDWVTPLLEDNQSLRSVTETRPGIKLALERANSYLNLASLLSVLLAGITIAMAAKRFVKRNFLSCAMMRCIGATQRQIVCLYGIGLLFLGVVGSLLGCVLGYLTHFIFNQLLADFFQTALPSANWQPVFTGMLTGLVILIGFALPPLLTLRHVPTIVILRNNAIPATAQGELAYLLATFAMLFLLWWHTQNWQLTLFIALGTLVAYFVLFSIAYFMIRLLGQLRRGIGVTWRYGLTSLVRRASSNSLQVVAFGLAIMAILLLAIVRTDLLDTWQNQLPAETPNYFLINIQPSQLNAVENFLNENELSNSGLYPMVRGRLTQLNEQPILSVLPEDAHQNNALHRELNLSWTQHIPKNNQVVAGVEWDEFNLQKKGISIESKLADNLQLQLGDELGFQIGSQLLTAPIVNIREVEWGTFQPNFYVLFPSSTLEDLPTSYIASFYLPQQANTTLIKLLNNFPTLTLIDIDAILAQVRDIVQKISLLVELIFIFGLVTGIVLLIATIQSSMDERLRESALLRTLGASSKVIRTLLLSEFVCLGLLAGTLAAGSANLLGWLIASQVFQVTYQFNLWLWFIGITLATSVISTAGMLTTKAIRKQTPVEQLRQTI